MSDGNFQQFENLGWKLSSLPHAYSEEAYLETADDDVCPRCYPMGCDCSDSQRPYYTRQCIHGTTIDDGSGADLMCGYCEDGVSLKDYYLDRARREVHGARSRNPRHQYNVELDLGAADLPFIAKLNEQIRKQLLERRAEILARLKMAACLRKEASRV